MRGQRIGILCGGPLDPVSSPELMDPLEVGLGCGPEVQAALSARGQDAVLIELGRDLDVALRSGRIGVAFLASRGRIGEDGAVQGLLELLSIPYTGSNLLSTALALDCQKSRAVLRQHNLPTPAFYTIDATAPPAPQQEPHGEAAEPLHSGFGYPAVLRPRHDNPRCLPRVVGDDAGFQRAVAEVRRFDDDVVVERYAAGHTVAVGLLDGKVLGALSLCGRDERGRLCRSDPAGLPAAGEDGGRYGALPPRLSPERLHGVTELARQAARALGCQGPVRVDVLVSDRGNEVLLSVNPRPALAPESLLGRAAQQAGLAFADLVDAVLAGAVLHGRRPRAAVLRGPALERRDAAPTKSGYGGPDRRMIPAEEAV